MSDGSGILRVAGLVRDRRYADAAAVFAAGSIVRGEGTVFSDLDLVVVYPRLPCAYRESFRCEGYPVEAFVHDPETLHYFFLEVDRPSGSPSLARMVTEGIEIPASNDLSRSLNALAASVLAMGPPPLTPEQLDRRRYGITDLLDDVRDPRSSEELAATGAQLFESLADYHLRARGLWSAKGKAILRALARTDPALGGRFSRSFEDLFTKGDARAVIALAEDLLAPDGGLLFDGYRLDAPSSWRKPITS